MASNFPTGIDFAGSQILNVRFQVLAVDPANPADGQAWYNSTQGLLKVRVNGVTISLGRLDQITPPGAALNMNAQRITALADATGGTDATTLQQVQALVAAVSSGMAWKDSARVAVSSNVNVASPGSILDGVTFAAGDQNRRVLLIGQTAAAENGLYDWNGGAVAMTRTPDANTDGRVLEMVVPVEQGSQADTGWILTTDAVTLGTTTLSFTRIFGGTAVAGTKKFALLYGGLATQTITHNLGTTDFVWSCRDATTNTPVFPDVVPIDNNTAEARETVAPGANSRRISIVG